MTLLKIQHLMISVCIATHNGEHYLQQQIDSILCQLSSNDEIVISDDGSNDSTIEILDSFHDSRIRIYYLTSPKGLPNYRYATLNFENALKYAQGDYIFMADQDDVWLPDKVMVMMEYLHIISYVTSVH